MQKERNIDNLLHRGTLYQRLEVERKETWSEEGRDQELLMKKEHKKIRPRSGEDLSTGLHEEKGGESLRLQTDRGAAQWSNETLQNQKGKETREVQGLNLMGGQKHGKGGKITAGKKMISGETHSPVALRGGGGWQR